MTWNSGNVTSRNLKMKSQISYSDRKYSVCWDSLRFEIPQSRFGSFWTIWTNCDSFTSSMWNKKLKIDDLGQFWAILIVSRVVYEPKCRKRSKSVDYSNLKDYLWDSKNHDIWAIKQIWTILSVSRLVYDMKFRNFQKWKTQNRISNLI